MGVETFIQPADITNANKKLLLAFCAQLFNTNPNLTVEVCFMLGKKRLCIMYPTPEV